MDMNIKMSQRDVLFFNSSPYRALRVIRHEQSRYDAFLAAGHEWTKVSFAFAEQFLAKLEEVNGLNLKQRRKVVEILNEWLKDRYAQKRGLNRSGYKRG